MKKFRYQQWTGVVLIILGVIALILSHSFRSEVGEIQSPVTIENSGSVKKSQYLIIGGIVLIAFGAWMVFRGKKR